MISYITTPFKWFFKLESSSGLLLLLAATLALILSNSNLGEYYFGILESHILIGTQSFGLDLSILHWINDVLMCAFFFVVTLEIKREFIHGELSKPKQAALPIIGAGGTHRWLEIGVGSPSTVVIGSSQSYFVRFQSPIPPWVETRMCSPYSTKSVTMLLGRPANRLP